MADIIRFFQAEMDKPGLFSLFHIISLIIILGITIFISVVFKNCKEKTYKRIIFVFWSICIILEIMKQIIKSFVYGPPHHFIYSFYDFPFHMCSTMFYLAPVLIFMKREKHPNLYDSITGYMCFFVLFAGLVVVLYNQVVMSNLIFTNIQTMIHHGAQVVLGVFMVVWNRDRLSLKMFFESLIVLAIFIVLAIIINTILTPYVDGIDMFYLNPLQVSSIPIASDIQANAGFIVYLLVYLIGIFSIGLIFYFIEKGLIKLSTRKSS